MTQPRVGTFEKQAMPSFATVPTKLLERACEKFHRNFIDFLQADQIRIRSLDGLEYSGQVGVIAVDVVGGNCEFERLSLRRVCVIALVTIGGRFGRYGFFSGGRFGFYRSFF